GGVAGDAATLHIEQQLRVDRADGRTVVGLHVVGGDLEGRHRVDVGGLREQQRVVVQMRERALRVFDDADVAQIAGLAASAGGGLDDRLRGRVAGDVID